MSTSSHSSPSVSAFGCGAWLPWFSASVCRPRPHRLSSPVREASSCGEPRVGQALPGYCGDERIQSFKRMPFHVPFVETESELIDVPMEMASRNLMVNAVDTALQDGPDALNAI